MKKPRQVISTRLTPETLKDIQLLQKLRGYKTRTEAMRFLIHTGFANLGNWRKASRP